MNRSVERVILVASAVALTATPALSASAQPPRPQIPYFLGDATFPLDQAAGGDVCGFPVTVAVTRGNQYVIQETVDSDGARSDKITGRLQATVVNDATGKSLSYSLSGPGTVTVYPSGAFTIDAYGPNLLWTLPRNSYPGVPTLSYTNGKVHVEVAADGRTTAYSLASSPGHAPTDVCALLAE